MIQTALNGILAILLTKFVLNDVPHAIGLTSVNPATQAFRPAYILPEGVYDWTKVVSMTPDSAYHAIAYASLLGLTPLAKYSWRYMSIPVGKINGWVSVFYKYVGYSPAEAYNRAVSGGFPINDFYELSNEADYWPKEIELIPGSQGDIERRESFGYWLKENITRAHKIRDEMMRSGVYYPPILKSDYGVIDGAHRSAMLWGIHGAEFRMKAWVMGE